VKTVRRCSFVPVLRARLATPSLFRSLGTKSAQRMAAGPFDQPESMPFDRLSGNRPARPQASLPFLPIP
jgi:hypothetical protein